LIWFLTGLQKRADFKQIFLDNLPDILDDEQKENKLRSNLKAPRKSGIIEVFGHLLKMSK
jgi:ATP-dependent DNA helicase RecG